MDTDMNQKKNYKNVQPRLPLQPMDALAEERHTGLEHM